MTSSSHPRRHREQAVAQRLKNISAFPLALAIVALAIPWQLEGLAASQRAAAGEFARVVAIQDDFERNALLYPLAANADEAQLRRLFAELEQQPPTPHRYDIARVLYIRFVAVDPAAAARHALRRAGKPSWLGAVFRAWAHVDLEAAVGRAAGLNGEAMRVVAAAILELDLDAQQRAFVVEQLQAEAVAQHASAWSAYTTDTDDMAAAWERALQSGANVREQLRAVAIAWAAVEPRQAMAMAATLDHSLRFAMELAIFGHWNSNDATGSIEWLEKAAPANRSPYLVRRAMSHLAKADIDIALAKVDELPEVMREHALQGVLRFMTEEQPQRAFEHFRSLDFAKQAAVLMQVAGYAPAQADSIAWAGTLHPKLQPDALDMILHRMHIVDPNLALDLTDDIPTQRLKEQWVRSLAPREVRRNPNDAWHWATSLPTDLQEESGVVGAVFAAWHSIDRDAATQHLLALRNSPVRDRALLATIRDFSNNPTKYDHSSVDRFLNAVADADAKHEAAAILRGHYTTIDPNPALAERYRQQSK